MPDFPRLLGALPPQGILSTYGQGSAYADAVVNSGSAFNQLVAWPAANIAKYCPVILNTYATAYKIGWTNGATVSGNIDVGIYDETGAKVVTLGTTVQSGVSSVQVGDIADTALAPGLYYLAMAMDNLTGTVRGSNANTLLSVSSGVRQQATAFVLPATATFATNASALVPAIAVALAGATF